tara:strand:- start:118 stop:1101 length:984 start_codon:yes stop_codon:yes gene_type:complete
MTKTALITGITGQDGSYLAEFLLKKKYKVHGIVRRVAAADQVHRLWRIKDITKNITLHSCSVESYSALAKIVRQVKPNEIYHLAAQSYVGTSFVDEFSTINTNVNGTLNILSSIRDFSPKTKFYFAGTSEMFGKVETFPQRETTPFHPRSSYGISKVTGFDLTRNYREAYKLFCCTGILFNHESPRRGYEFVTRKITHAVARIKFGLQKDLKLGNTKSQRDWGHAKDYVEAMWLMLQQKKPDDFVVGTGKQHSVEDFAKLAFSLAGLNFKDYVKVDKKFIRPAEVDTLKADYSKAKRILKWKPKTSFRELVREMVESDINSLKSSGH